MIVRYLGDKTLADVEALCVELRKRPDDPPRSPATIRKHCTPVKVDEGTGRQLYDVDQAREALKDVRGRSPHRRRQRRLTNDRI